MADSSSSSDDEVGFSNLFKTTYADESITIESLSPSAFSSDVPADEPSSTVTEYVKVYRLKLSRAATTDYDKTGEILWPAAYSLARFLAVNAHRFFAGKTVLELGAGMGLPSVVLLGNAEPSLLIGSDHQSSVLTVLRQNLDRASREPARHLRRVVELPAADADADGDEPPQKIVVSEQDVTAATGGEGRAVVWDVAKFEWGKQEHIDAIRAQASRLLQQQHFPGFDYIIASDVVYSSDAVAGLLSSVRALLRPDGGRFIMAHRTRWAIVDRALAAAWSDYRISPAADAHLYTSVTIPDDEQIFIQALDA